MAVGATVFCQDNSGSLYFPAPLKVTKLAALAATEEEEEEEEEELSVSDCPSLSD
jgi:hypothetical protein